MLPIRLTDHFRDHRPQDRACVHALLNRLREDVTSREDLVSGRCLGVKHLKGFPYGTWRHRHGDHRTVFTLQEHAGDAVLLVQVMGHRGSVYEKLPRHLASCGVSIEDELEDDRESAPKDAPTDTDTPRHARIMWLPGHVLQSVEMLGDHLEHQFAYHPVLDADQRIDWNPTDPRNRVLRVQGAAGTGKTTVAIQEFMNALATGRFPVMILPNGELVRQAVKQVLAHDSSLLLLTWPTDSLEEASHGAILTLDRFCAWLGVAQQVPRRGPVNARVDARIARYAHHLMPLQGTDWFGLWQGYIRSDDPHKDKDPLYLENARAIEALQDGRIILQQMEDHLKAEALVEPATRAEALIQRVRAGDAPPLPRDRLMILDEVQDLYPSELRALLEVAKVWDAPVVMGGDEDAFPEVRKLGKRQASPATDPDTCLTTDMVPRFLVVTPEWHRDVVALLPRWSLEGSEGSRAIALIRERGEEARRFRLAHGGGRSPVLTLTVPEAKGLEFDALLVVHPFEQAMMHQVRVEDLHDWYTMITRARRRVWILVTREELDWWTTHARRAPGSEAEEVAWDDSMTAVFQESVVTPQDFVQGILAQLAVTLKVEDARSIYRNQVLAALTAWCLGQGPLPALLDLARGIGLEAEGAIPEIESCLEEVLFESGFAFAELSDDPDGPALEPRERAVAISRRGRSRPWSATPTRSTNRAPCQPIPSKAPSTSWSRGACPGKKRPSRPSPPGWKRSSPVCERRTSDDHPVSGTDENRDRVR